MGCSPKIGGIGLEILAHQELIRWLLQFGASALTCLIVDFQYQPLIWDHQACVRLDERTYGTYAFLKLHGIYNWKIIWDFARPGTWTQVLRVNALVACQLSCMNQLIYYDKQNNKKQKQRVVIKTRAISNRRVIGCHDLFFFTTPVT